VTQIAPAASTLPPIARLSTAAPDDSRVATAENLEEAGQRFEALFVSMMLSSMRKAKLGDDLFDSQALDQFRDMQDTKTSETMAVHMPLGIGRAMTEFLSQNRPELGTPE
jgi:peptidoglycan hydrolase FlgJ